MSSGLTLVRKPLAVLPDAMLEKILNDFKTGFGYACAQGGCVDSLYVPSKEFDLLENLKEVLDTLKKETLVLHFMQTNEGFLRPEDQQPFSIIKDANGNDILMAVLEGAFPQYTEEKSPLSNEFRVVRDYLAEKCKEVFATSEANLAKQL